MPTRGRGGGRGRSPFLREALGPLLERAVLDWDPHLHPRDAFGKFSEKIGGLTPRGQNGPTSVRLPDGTTVTRDPDAIPGAPTYRVVRSGRIVSGFHRPEHAAFDAFSRSARATNHDRAIGGRQRSSFDVNPLERPHSAEHYEALARDAGNYQRVSAARTSEYDQRAAASIGEYRRSVLGHAANVRRGSVPQASPAVTGPGAQQARLDREFPRLGNVDHVVVGRATGLEPDQVAAVQQVSGATNRPDLLAAAREFAAGRDAVIPRSGAEQITPAEPARRRARMPGPGETSPERLAQIANNARSAQLAAAPAANPARTSPVGADFRVGHTITDHSGRRYHVAGVSRYASGQNARGERTPGLAVRPINEDGGWGRARVMGIDHFTHPQNAHVIAGTPGSAGTDQPEVRRREARTRFANAVTASTGQRVTNTWEEGPYTYAAIPGRTFSTATTSLGSGQIGPGAVQVHREAQPVFTAPGATNALRVAAGLPEIQNAPETREVQHSRHPAPQQPPGAAHPGIPFEASRGHRPEPPLGPAQPLPAPRGPDIGPPPQIAAHHAGSEGARRAQAIVNGIHGYSHGGLTAKVTGVESGEFRGVVLDQTGRRVGHFSRDFRSPTSIYHAFFEIPNQEHRSTGFGAKFIDHSFATYKANGVKDVHVTAGLDVGGYMWAKMGFEFASADKAEAARSVLRGREDRLRQHATEGRVSKDLVEEFIRQVHDGEVVSPAQIAAWGRSRTWEETRGGKSVTLWLGKALLAGNGWSGIKKL